MVPMQYLFVPSLLAALGLPFSVIAVLCDKHNRKSDVRLPSIYYEGWAADKTTPDMIPFDRIKVVNFAFALDPFCFSIALAGVC